MSADPVRSKDELIRHLFELLDENDAVEWPNDSAYTYLQAMAAWLESADRRGVDTSQCSWQLIADMLDEARGYGT